MKRILTLIMTFSMLFTGCQGQENEDKRIIEQQLIKIIGKGEVKECKMELLMERNDSSFYVKTLELRIKNDKEFNYVFLLSSIIHGYGIGEQMDMKCEYLLMNTRHGYLYELTEEQLDKLPGLSGYLTDMLRKQKPKETIHGFITQANGLIAPQSSEGFFCLQSNRILVYTDSVLCDQ